MWTPTKTYPNAHRNRLRGSHPSLKAPRRKLIKAALKNLLMLQVLFLALFAYIFGCLFQQSSYTHNLNILFVDYDGGVIGDSVRNAYGLHQGNNFPTLYEKSPTLFPNSRELREEVCSARYWAALYTSPGASERLAVALSSSTAVTSYDRGDVLTFVWNEARYSAIVDSAIQGNLQNLSNTARLAYTSTNGSSALSALSTGHAANINILANPWTLTSSNIQATTQGSRLIYNTLVIILILIQEFFYLGTVNGLYASLKIYNRIYPHRIIAYRNIISLTYTFIGSLCVTGMIWAFRAGWDVNAAQFFLTWMVLWLFAHANFLSLDIFTIWVPAAYVPMALITWMILNVASILVPFELSSRFYRWAYVMPAHEVYQVLTDIWSRGCNPQLYYALPILFALELSGLFFSALGVYRRCHFAVIAQEAEEKAFRAHVDTALAFEEKRDKEREQARKEGNGGEMNGNAVLTAESDDRNEMEKTIRGENQEVRRGLTRSGTSCNFGPSFDLAFKDESEDSLR